MTEFAVAIKQFKRMCRYYDDYDGDRSECPLYYKWHGCDISHCRRLAFYDKEFQNVVMSWAEDHPEPVYPTWYEWLTSVYPAAWALIADKPIPADIAQKLGIEPKEDV